MEARRRIAIQKSKIQKENREEYAEILKKVQAAKENWRQKYKSTGITGKTAEPEQLTLNLGQPIQLSLFESPIDPLIPGHGFELKRS